MLHVSCCLLPIACCVCALLIAYCMLSNIYWAFYATCCLLQIACGIRHVFWCWVSHDTYCWLHVVCCFIRVSRYKIHVWHVESGGPSGSCWILHVICCLLFAESLNSQTKEIHCTDELQKEGKTKSLDLKGLIYLCMQYFLNWKRINFCYHKVGLSFYKCAYW